MMAEAVDTLAKNTPGKKSLAIESFAKALRTLPKTIAENGGYDATELVTQLRAAHNSGQTTAGLNMKEGTVGCMKEMGITESFKVKCQSLVSAAEAAEMVIRVDQVITCAPRQRGEEY
jgi:T-complex protein 1 subunit beta